MYPLPSPQNQCCILDSSLSFTTNNIDSGVGGIYGVKQNEIIMNEIVDKSTLLRKVCQPQLLLSMIVDYLHCFYCLSHQK